MSKRTIGLAVAAVGFLALVGGAALKMRSELNQLRNRVESLKQPNQEVEGSKQEVRTRRLVIEDKDGKTRAILNAGETGPMLSMYDEKGRTRALLQVLKHEKVRGPQMVLYNKKGKTRVMLSHVKNGGALETGLTVADKAGKVRAGLLMRDGIPIMALKDKNGNARIGTWVRNGRPRMLIWDKNRNPVWSKPE